MENYEETKRGFRIVPKSDFDFRQVRGDIARSTCPDCREERGHPGDPSVRMNLKTGLGKCFHCGRKYILRENLRTYNRRTLPQHPHHYILPKCDDLTILHTPELLSQLAERGLTDESLLMRMHVMESKRGSGSSAKPCFAFPSYDGKVIVNVSYRTLDKDMTQEKDCELIPWNIDAALGRTELFITEGRLDAIALAQCGHENVISVANGAMYDVQNFDRFRFSHLDQIETIYIAGDNDTAGLKLRERLAIYFGEYRCRVVEWEWPSEDGKKRYEVKDANDCLIKGGAAAIEYCIDHATECRIVGEVALGDVEAGVDDVRENGLPEGKTLGLYELDDCLKFLPGQFMVLTGSPGTGKSTFADFIAIRLLQRYGWRCALYSPEKRPVRNHYAELEAKLLGYNIHDRVRVSDGNHERCKRYLDENIFHIGGDIRNDMDTILHTARQMKLKHGIRMLLIDPFAYIDLSHESGVTDYEKINQNIKALAKFSADEEMLTILVAHPRKPILLASGRYAMPTLYDINGSSMFYNLCDTGIILHRDESINRVVVYVEKVRDQPRMGAIGHCAICFDPESGRYNIAHEDKLPNGTVRYIDYDINHKIWLPQEDIREGALDFDNSSSIGEQKDDCPF